MSIPTTNSEQQFIDHPPTPISFFKEIWELGIWITIACAAYLMLALLTYTPQDPGWSYSGPRNVAAQNITGILGAWIADLLIHLFGYLAFLIPIVLIWRSLLVLCQDNDNLSERFLSFSLRWWGLTITILSGAILADLYITKMIMFLPTGPGGIAGQAFAPLLLKLIHPLGGILTLILSFTLGFTLLSDFPWGVITEKLGAFIYKIAHWLAWPIVLLIHYYMQLKTFIANLFKVTPKPKIEIPIEESFTTENSLLEKTKAVSISQNENSPLALSKETADLINQLAIMLPYQQPLPLIEELNAQPIANITASPVTIAIQSENFVAQEKDNIAQITTTQMQFEYELAHKTTVQPNNYVTQLEIENVTTPPENTIVLITNIDDTLFITSNTQLENIIQPIEIIQPETTAPQKCAAQLEVIQPENTDATLQNSNS